MKRDDLIGAVLRDMQARVGDRQARQWAHALGLKAALADAARRSELDLVLSLLNQGCGRSDIRDRLRARGLSRPTAYRRIAEALDQRRPRHETGGDDSPFIVNHPTAT